MKFMFVLLFCFIICMICLPVLAGEKLVARVDLKADRKIRKLQVRSYRFETDGAKRRGSPADRKALHNFKYFTWVEQQGKTSDELRRLWDEDFWKQVFSEDVVDEWDRLIEAFNG